MYFINYFYVTVTPGRRQVKICRVDRHGAAPKCPRAESRASSWPCAELAPSCPISTEPPWGIGSIMIIQLFVC